MAVGRMNPEWSGQGNTLRLSIGQPPTQVPMCAALLSSALYMITRDGLLARLRH